MGVEIKSMKLLVRAHLHNLVLQARTTLTRRPKMAALPGHSNKTSGLARSLGTAGIEPICSFAWVVRLASIQAERRDLARDSAKRAPTVELSAPGRPR